MRGPWLGGRSVPGVRPAAGAGRMAVGKGASPAAVSVDPRAAAGEAVGWLAGGVSEVGPGASPTPARSAAA